MTADERTVLDYLWAEVDAHPEQTRCARRAFRIEMATGLDAKRVGRTVNSLHSIGAIEVEINDDFGFIYYRPRLRL
jgi:hypothetical protein